VPRSLYLSTSNVPGIPAVAERLSVAIRRLTSRAVSVMYIPRPTLTHATIFRGEGPSALVRELR